MSPGIKTQNRLKADSYQSSPGLLFPLILFCILCALSLLSGCGTKHTPGPQAPQSQTKQLSSLGYTIQAGAFSQADNAIRLTEKLDDFGLEPYYFHHPSGLYKVRFGNFSTRKTAESRARHLVDSGYITTYYIVRPQDSSLAGSKAGDHRHLREKLVQTAKDFIGLPYQWGGTRAEEGFDCSGLTMAVYRLNGLDLPRTSRDQFGAGTAINRNTLTKGDLVFFAPSASQKVSHVGVYAGNDRFIHAPSRGKTVRISSLKSPYYQNSFAGARTYLQ
ncbi:MAG: NlpC/P60 family protein [Desulfovermiculus sp.]